MSDTETQVGRVLAAYDQAAGALREYLELSLAVEPELVFAGEATIDRGVIEIDAQATRIDVVLEKRLHLEATELEQMLGFASRHGGELRLDSRGGGRGCEIRPVVAFRVPSER